MRKIRSRNCTCSNAVIHICCIAPPVLICASSHVSPAAISRDGDIFQPRPRFLAAVAPVPEVAMPPLPTSPVRFSGDMERDLALDSRERFAIDMPNPLKCDILGYLLPR